MLPAIGNIHAAEFLHPCAQISSGLASFCDEVVDHDGRVARLSERTDITPRYEFGQAHRDGSALVFAREILTRRLTSRVGGAYPVPDGGNCGSSFSGCFLAWAGCMARRTWGGERSDGKRSPPFFQSIHSGYILSTSRAAPSCASTD
jgi:hypothetical protein